MEGPLLPRGLAVYNKLSAVALKHFISITNIHGNNSARREQLQLKHGENCNNQQYARVLATKVTLRPALIDRFTRLEVATV